MKYINNDEFSNTYSIVAYDAEGMQLGIGMQTHYFAACYCVVGAEPGAGIVSTQSYRNPFYAFEG